MLTTKEKRKIHASLKKQGYKFRNKKGQFARKTVPLTLILGIVWIVAGLYAPASVQTYTADAHIELEQVDKLDIVLEHYLERLSYCESRWDDNALVLDTNDRNSRGRFQWQARSAIYYADKYDLRGGLEDSDIINLLHTEKFSRMLAKTVITSERNGWKNWYNCGRAVGLDTFINQYYF